MARKGHRQRKARTPRKSNRAGLSSKASTDSTATEPPNRIEKQLNRELRRIFGTKVAKS